jgi:cell division protein FtsW
MLLATGITASLLLQALLNMAVIAAVSPPTGMTLPFVSYGGSSLVASLVGIGILLNISRFGVDRTLQTGEQTGRKAHERDDLGRGDRRPRLSGTGRRQTAHSFQSTTERFPWETAKPEQRRRAAAKSAQERK